MKHEAHADALTDRGFDVRATVFQIGATMFSIPLGRVLGFPIRVNASFLLLLAAVMFWAGGIEGVTIALIAGASIILHELGHAVTARRLGVPVAGIELHFFGGAAQISEMPRRPNDEIAIAIAGPAVSFALAAAGWVLATVTGAQLFVLFGMLNLGLAVFNLLPAFPSDGGRILRALLARKRGLVRATDLAVTVGRVLCVGLILLGLSPFGSLQLVAVAVVLWMMGSAERLSARLRGDRGAWRGDGSASAVSPAVEYFPPNTPIPPVARPSAFPGASLHTRDGRVVVVWQR
jgi:Zn-dependent protease